MMNRDTTSSQRVLNQLDSLENALSGIRQNIQIPNQLRELPTTQQQGLKSVQAEVSNLKQSLGGMMDLVVSEIDSIKKEMYLGFGHTHKSLLSDVERLKSDNTILEKRLVQLEEMIHLKTTYIFNLLQISK